MNTPQKPDVPEPHFGNMTESQRIASDIAIHEDKQRDGYGQRNYRRALELQVQANPNQWGME